MRIIENLKKASFLRESDFFRDDYLEIPLIVTYPIYNVNSIKIGISMGPSFGIGMDYSKMYNSEHFSFDNDPEFKNTLTDSYPQTEMSLPHGGIFINTGFITEYKNQYIELRYNHGLRRLGSLAGLVMHGERIRTLEIIYGIHIKNNK